MDHQMTEPTQPFDFQTPGAVTVEWGGAARMGDHVNPQKASSGSQFYIVDGRKFARNELDAMAGRNGKNWTEDQKKAYETLGGAPHLDGDYTVFGEVISGMDVVDKIAAVQTGGANRPLKEIKMTMEIVK